MRKDDPSAMIVPNNEGMVCDAVVRALEKWSRKTRADVRLPETDGIGPPVDLRLKLGDQDYAIEHTRIESFENQIGTSIVANRIIRHVSKRIPDPFPSPAYYELQFPIDVSLPKGKPRRDRALNGLVEWVRANERALRERNSAQSLLVRNPYMANDSIRGTPPGFGCEFELLHWPIVPPMRVTPGTLSFRFILPDDPEGPRAERLQRAFSEKCPKLEACKAEGAWTVLVLESSDPGLVSFEFRGDLLPLSLAGCTNAPDDVFLVETCADLWRVWLLKRDEGHWPETGMPELGVQYYDPDPSDVPGIPEWLETIPQPMRDALQLDRMYTPFLPGWAPLTFQKDVLDNPTAGASYENVPCTRAQLDRQSPPEVNPRSHRIRRPT